MSALTGTRFTLTNDSCDHLGAEAVEEGKGWGEHGLHLKGAAPTQ